MSSMGEALIIRALACCRINCIDARMSGVHCSNPKVRLLYSPRRAGSAKIKSNCTDDGSDDRYFIESVLTTSKLSMPVTEALWRTAVAYFV